MTEQKELFCVGNLENTIFGGRFLKRVMESSLEIPPPAHPTTELLIVITFFAKTVKKSISTCYIRFYENYRNIKSTLWYLIFLYFLIKIQEGTLTIISKFVYKHQKRIWSMAMNFLEMSEISWFLTGIFMSKNLHRSYP